MTSTDVAPEETKDRKKRAKRDPGAATVAATPPKLRRRPILVAAGVAAVSVGALLSVWAYTSSSTAQSVIAVRETITRGELIEEQDLVAVNIAVDPALRPIAAGDADQVIGKRAALDIAGGGVVTTEQVTETLLPPADQSIVGVSLGPAMLPANQVKVGDTVRVVEIPGAQAATTEADGDAGPLPTVDATVVGVYTDATVGNTIVNILVPAQNAPDVASWSAASRAAIVVDSTEQ